MSQFAFNTNIFGNPTAPYYQCVAVSTSPDPTGTWYRYAYQSIAGGTDVFNDYGKSGVWRDAYYMSVNQFSGPALGTWQGAGVYAYDRTKMLAGDPTASAVYFNLGTSYGGLLPADWDGVRPPAQGEPEFFMSFDNTSAGCGAANANGCLQMWKFHSDFTTPANSTVTGPTILGVSPITLPCNGTASNCVPQSGTGNTLDTLGDRLMWHLSYRNFGTHESLVVTQSVDPDGGGSQNAALRWYEVRDPNGTPGVYQQSTYNPTTTQDRWMGSMAMDKFGNMALGYSISSSSMFPSIAFTGRLAGDPLNTMQSEATMFSGSGSQTGTLTRWGDYSSMTVDPIDGCTFWYTDEYLAASGTFNWHTRIGNFKFAGCVACSPPSVPTGVTASPASSSSNSVSWSSSGAGVTYNVYRSTESCPAGIFEKLNATPVNGTTYTDTTATSGTTYFYRVTAIDALTGNCESVASACVNVTTASCTPPGDPTIGTVVANAPSSLTVSWTAGLPAGSTYTVYRADGTCPGGGTYAAVATGVSGTSWTDNTVIGGNSYSYEVSAVDATGSCISALSACAAGTAYGDCATAPTFAGLGSATASAGSTCTIDLAWSAGTANCSGPVSYSVYRSTNSGFAPGASNRIATRVSGTSYSDTSALAANTTYYYIVRAMDESNNVEEANTVRTSATTAAGCTSAPFAIQAFTVTTTGTATGGQNLLEWWDPSSGSSGTTVTINYRTDQYPTSPSDPSATTLVTNRPVVFGAVDTYTHTGLTNGVTYYYAIWVRY